MKGLVCFIICVLILCVLNGQALALTIDVSNLPESDRESSLAYSQLIPLDSAIERQPISCFDISENGWIALGFEKSTEKSICVYDQDGLFQYGYAFENYGTISLGWNDDKLDILLNRGGHLMTLDQKNKILIVIDTRNLPSDSRAYKNSMRPFESLKVENRTYTLEHNLGFLRIFAPGYARLVVTDEDGLQQIIYDATEFYNARFVLTVLLVLGIISYTIIMLLPYFQKRKIT